MAAATKKAAKPKTDWESIARNLARANGQNPDTPAGRRALGAMKVGWPQN